MKKKIVSTFTAVTMLVAFLLVFSVTTFAAAPAGLTYEEVHATGVEATASGIVTSSSALRANAENALGAPDATQTGGEDKFASLRNFESATYTFDDGDTARLIANYRGEDEDVKPDLSLIEVTWGTGWHVEAVDVYLVGAYVLTNVGGYDVVVPAGEILIGTAYNKVGVAAGLAADAVGGFKVETEKIGNHQYTNIYFPDSVVYARGVKLVDATVAANTPVRTSTTYNDKDDGFDLDALSAWYTVLDKDGGLSADLSFSKFVDIDVNGDGEAYDAGVGFKFDLYQLGGEGYAYLATYVSDDLGVVTIEGLGTGSYKVVEQADANYRLANYQDGLYFNVYLDAVEWLNLEDGYEAPEVLNQYVPQYEPDWKTDTSWAGYVTNGKTFPMHNKSMFAVAPQGNVQRSGQTNWAMAMLYNGEATSADIVMGQNSDIGDITVEYAEGGFVVTGLVTNPACKVTHVHADASSDIGRFTNAQGNGNFAVNQGVEMGEDGSFSFFIPYSYTEGTVYVGIHMESAIDLNYPG